MDKHSLLDRLFQWELTDKNPKTFARITNYYKIAGTILQGKRVDWLETPIVIASALNIISNEFDSEYLMSSGVSSRNDLFKDRYIFKWGEHIITIKKEPLRAETEYRKIIVQSLKLTGFTYRSRNQIQPNRER
jgi:hypothetical protein